MNSNKQKAGFTLIELLVVVAIVAVMASVVLVALGTTRKKGGDAGVKTNLNTVRGAGEVFYVNNLFSYLPSGGSTFTQATCPVYNASGTNMLSKDSTIAAAIAEAVNRGSGSSCYNSANVWSVAVGLNIAANTSWCVDSSGASKQEAFAPASAINGSTFLCN
jgi:prepilin-type N-terminal cleavage/methylation domain-containing protein